MESYKINKQQILFLLCIFTGTMIFYSSYTNQKMEIFTIKKEVRLKKRKMTFTSLFPNKNYYATTEQRFLFRRVNYNKKLPPLKMAFPVWENFKKNFLPPLPFPKKSMPPQIFKQNITEIIIPEKDKLKLLIKTKKMSRLAKLLQKKIQKNDVVLMNNGKRYFGKIIKQNKNSITVYSEINNKSTNYNLLKKSIQKITKTISLKEICQKEARKFKDLSVAKRIIQGKVFAELKQNTLAIKTFKKSIDESPDNENLYCAFAEYWLEKLEHEKAAYWINKGYLKVPDAKKLKQKYLNLLETFHFTQKISNQIVTSNNHEDIVRKIKITIQNENYKKAIFYINQISSSNDEEVIYWKSYVFYKQNSLKQSLDLCIKIKDSEKWRTKARNIEGCIYYLYGDLQKAQDIFLSNAHNAESWYNLSLVYYAANAKEEAIKILSVLGENTILFPIHATLAFFQEEKEMKLAIQSINEKPENFLGHYVLGEINYKKNQLLKAYNYYIKAMQLNFDFTPTLIKLAEITYKEKNYTKSILFLEELLKRKKILPNEYIAEIYNSIAQIYMYKKQPAQKYLQKSLQLGIQNIRTLKLLSFLANKKKNYTDAITFLNKILEISPQDAYAKKYKKEITLNTKSSYWEDTFSRKNNNEIRRGWFEKEDNGVSIRLEDSQIFFAGKQKTNDVTFVSRKANLDKFLSISGEITTTAKAYVGIFISDGHLSFYFGKNKNGNIGIATHKQKKTWKWENQQGMQWPKSPAVDISVHRSLDEKNLYRLYVNDQFIMEKKARFRGELQVGFFGKAEYGLQWSLHIDNAKIIELR